MSTVAMRSGGGAARSGGERSRRGLAWWAAVLVGVGLLALLVAWLLGWFRVTTDPRVQEVLQLQEEAMQKFAANGGPQTVEEANEAVATMESILDKVQSLPVPLQEQVGKRSSSMFHTMKRAEVNAYYNAPPHKRREVLDRQIRMDETMKQAFSAALMADFIAGSVGSAEPSGGNSRRGGGSAPAAGGPAAGPQQSTPPASIDRHAGEKRVIDATTPQQRARDVEYRRANEVRRVQLGLPNPNRFGG